MTAWFNVNVTASEASVPRDGSRAFPFEVDEPLSDDRAQRFTPDR